MANPRKKGSSGELEFCRWLKETLDLDVTPKRNLELVRSGGADVLDVEPYCFEVKRREKLDLFEAWSQVNFAAKELDAIPIVAFRMNRGKWQFLIPSYFLMTELNFGYIQLTEKVFRAWIKDHYRGFCERA